MKDVEQEDLRDGVWLGQRLGEKLRDRSNLPPLPPPPPVYTPAPPPADRKESAEWTKSRVRESARDIRYTDYNDEAAALLRHLNTQNPTHPTGATATSSSTSSNATPPHTSWVCVSHLTPSRRLYEVVGINGVKLSSLDTVFQFQLVHQTARPIVLDLLPLGYEEGAGVEEAEDWVGGGSNDGTPDSPMTPYLTPSTSPITYTLFLG